jgi:hypothetical protein
MSKEHTLTCLAESVALPLPQGGPDSERSLSASANPTPSGSCESTGLTCQSMTTCEPSPVNATQGLLFSREDFPASRSVSPGSGQAREMTASSGRRWLPLLKLSGPLGSLARMCLESLAWNSTVAYLTWRPKATKAGRSLFQLAPSMPSTEETECGLWPTASSRDYKDTPGMARTGTNPDGSERKREDQLARAVYAGMWPTPRAGKTTDENEEAWQARKDKGDVSTPPLTLAVKMWPTPCANNGTGGATGLAGGSGNRLKLYKMLGEEEGKKMGCQSLNPYWVEWLMGYPLGWTDCGDSETRSCRKSRRS